MDARTDNVKTVYPTTNKVCGGYDKNNAEVGKKISDVGNRLKIYQRISYFVLGSIFFIFFGGGGLGMVDN